MLTWLRTGRHARFRSGARRCLCAEWLSKQGIYCKRCLTWVLDWCRHHVSKVKWLPSHVRTITISDMRRECSGCQERVSPACPCKYCTVLYKSPSTCAIGTCTVSRWRVWVHVYASRAPISVSLAQSNACNTVERWWLSCWRNPSMHACLLTRPHDNTCMQNRDKPRSGTDRGVKSAQVHGTWAQPTGILLTNVPAEAVERMMTGQSGGPHWPKSG